MSRPLTIFSLLILMFGILFGTAKQAQAGILIEPYFGYEITKNTITLVNDSELPGPATGSNYGLRLGYKAPLFFWVALDASAGKGKLTYDNSAATDQDMSRTNMGVTVGIDLPVFLRLWAGYGFSDKMQLSKPSSTDTFKGTNSKVGLGFSMIPFVSLNVEYLMRKYTEASGDTFTSNPDFSSIYKKLDQNSVLISVSVPFNL